MPEIEAKLENLAISDSEDNLTDVHEEQTETQLAEQSRLANLDHIEQTYGLTTIPDSNQEELPADEELAAEYPDDTTYIDLVHLKVHSLESLHLERFTHLESLNLRDNLVTSLNYLKALPDSSKESLQELDFYDNRIKHITSHLESFPNIETLDLSFNNIKHIKHLQNMTKLKELFFVQNRISKIEKLETLTAIENLEFGGNRIEVIENLNHFVNLRQLWLGQNRITKLAGLQGLKNLRVLSIQSNQIEKIEGLDDLTSLEEFYISHNKITKLEGLDKLENLQVLDVTGNGISTIEGLDNLANLTDFWCSYNQVADFNSIRQGLSKNSMLETVYFEGNPCQLSNPAMYRTRLKMNLEQNKRLVKIDALYLQSNKMVL